MAEDPRRRRFDDGDRKAVRLLLENFWILPERDLEAYVLVRERQAHLKHYFLDRFGYRLIVHRHFIKLEKVPAVPLAWMGIRELQHSRDYVMLCCLLAFLDERNIEEQFLLSHLCEEMKELYPTDEEAPPGSVRERLSWERWEHRKSLVRALRLAVDRGLVRQVDGQIEGFSRDEASEVLFEVAVVSRYFPISYPKELSRFHSVEALLAGTDSQEAGAAQSRRHRLHRLLLLAPAFYRHEAEPEDFPYLRNQRNRLRDDFESHTPYRLELTKNTAMLTIPESAHLHETFPDQRALTAVALHFAATVREQPLKAGNGPRQDGRWPLTKVEFEQLVAACRERTAHGWSKALREMSLPLLVRELRAELAGWKMIEEDEANGMVLLCPNLMRMVGRYPADYTGPRPAAGRRVRDGSEEARNPGEPRGEGGP